MDTDEFLTPPELAPPAPPAPAVTAEPAPDQVVAGRFVDLHSGAIVTFDPAAGAQAVAGDVVRPATVRDHLIAGVELPQ